MVSLIPEKYEQPRPGRIRVKTLPPSRLEGRPPGCLALPTELRTGENRGGTSLWLLSVIGLVAGLIAAACFFMPRSRVALPEVSRAELTVVDGRWHRRGETNLFLGFMIETYRDGARLSRSAISNGLLNGISEGWHTNGVLQVREHFQANVSHGLRTKWYDNRVKMSEAMIRAGKLDGTFRRWHENGQLAEQMEMKNGLTEGDALAFYPDGSLMTQARFEQGRLVSSKRWSNGKISQPNSSPSSEIGSDHQ